jgi:RNA recognition motif-containing protein
MSAETKTETKPREPVPESNTIRVRVPRRLTYEQLRKHFEDCGTITRLRYISIRGLAFIQLADVAAAKAAIELHNGKVWKVTPEHAREKKELEWRVDAGFARPPSGKRPAPAQAAPARPKISDVEVAVLHLPAVVEEDDVKQIFDGFEIKKIELPKARTNAKFRHAFVTLASHEAQEKAIRDVNGTTVEESTIVVEARRLNMGRPAPRRAAPRRRPAPRRGGAAAPKKKNTTPAEPNESVFIQVPRYTSHEQVKEELLKEFKDFKLFLRSRRFHAPPLCFVTFATTEEAKKCIEGINDKKWKFVPGTPDKGKEIEWTVRASFARPRRAKEAKPEASK